MPLGDKPECVKCNSKESVLWHSTGNGNLCNNCLESERKTTTTTTCNLDNVKIEEETAGGGSSKPSRKSTRITRFVQNNKSSLGVNKSTASIAQTVKNGTRGRGRRHIFKKNVIILLFTIITIITIELIENFCFSRWKRPGQQRQRLRVTLSSTRAPTSKWVTSSQCRTSTVAPTMLKFEGFWLISIARKVQLLRGFYLRQRGIKIVHLLVVK